jgi:hypothetical protein
VAPRAERSDHAGMTVALALQAPARLWHNPSPHFNSFLLNVDFRSAGGEEASAVGGGDSIPGAIAAASDALPVGLEWELVRWNHLYGD